MDMKISVITPSYNSGNSLEKAICSVLDQDYLNYEHIVIDGGSTDLTLDILAKYPHLIWTSEKDRGQAHAMNKGFARATGEVIVYLNADDYFLCGAFSSVIPFFKQKHKVIVGDIVVQKPNEYFINTPKVRLPEMIRHWEMNAFPYNPVGYFYRREVQEDFPFDEHFPNMMDLRFLLEAATKYEFFKINALLGVYRCLEKTKTLEDQQNSYYWSRENFSFIDKYAAMLPIDDLMQYEKDREQGYQMQRQWQQNSEEINPGQTVTQSSEKLTTWSKLRKAIRSCVKSNRESLARLPNTKTPPSAELTTPPVPPQLERYQLRALDMAASHMLFQGATILEVGGDMKFQTAREMVRRGAARVVSINYSPSFSSKKITDQIDSINMDIRNLDQLHETFDLVFGVAILEHLNNLDIALENIFKRLKNGGRVYLHGGPIWTSHLGHHVWLHTKDGIKYEFNSNNPIPDWGHLLYSSDEMNDILLKKGIPEDHIDYILKYIYNSERLCRFSTENYYNIFLKSKLHLILFNRIKWKSPDLLTKNILKSKFKKDDCDYSSGEIEVIMEKL